MFENSKELIKILWVSLFAFFAAFSKELNDMAKGEDENWLVFFSEILVNLVCGVICGLITLSVVSNIYLTLCAASVGGLFGLQAVKGFLKAVPFAKDIDLDGKDDGKSKNSRKGKK